MKRELCLGVNVDHVATLRQARGTNYPNPVDAVLRAEQAGADSITVHLREDRRHIVDADLPAILAAMRTHMNLEMAVTDEMVNIASKLRPSDCCLVPEKREELTTEGGLDVVGQAARVRDAVRRLEDAGIRVSLFVDPERDQLDAALAVGARVVELHTGGYADASAEDRTPEFERVADAARYGAGIGLTIHAGHGLNYGNVQPIAGIVEIVELNIGHAIVAQAVLDGFGPAVAEMKLRMAEARQ